MTRIRTLSTLLLLAVAVSHPAAAQDDDGFRWSVTPYGWFPKTTVDLRFQDMNIGSGTISFSDVLDTVDAAFMLDVEGGRGKWSGFADITYVDTSNTNERQLLTIDAKNEQMLIDAAVAYWPQGIDSSLSFFGGVRHSGLDNRYRFRIGDTVLSTQTSNDSYNDALLGVRYRFDLAERWAILTRADYSAGDSEGSYLLRASLAYAVGDDRRNRILVGYQHREAEYKDGDLSIELQLSGVTAGFSFSF